MKNPIRTAKEAWANHKTRHTSVGVTCAIADRISHLDPVVWDELVAPHSVMMSRRYLSALERAGPSNVVGRYALLYSDQRPMAAIAAQRVTVRSDQITIAGTSKRKRAAGVLTRTLKHAEQHMLVCGNLLSWGDHGLAIATGVSADERSNLMHGVAETLYRMRRADVLMGKTDIVMVKDVPPSREADAARLAAYSYRRLETEPNMVLNLKPGWSSFEDYLGAMTSSYRKNARKIVKDVEEAGILLRRIDPSSENASRLHELYMQVHSTASVRLFTLPQAFIPEVANAFGPDMLCTAAFKGHEMVGFVTTIKDNSTAIGYYVGFDRPTNQHTPIYFRLLYAAVQDAISLGCERLSLGRTALEPKARLGAKPEPMSVFLRHRVPMLNVIVKAAVRGVHHDDAPDRNPFKV